MTEEIHAGNVYVTRLTGPATLGADRALWQITVPNRRDYVQIDRAEAVVLAAALADSAADLPLALPGVP